MRWTSRSLLVGFCAALFTWAAAMAQGPELTLQDALARSLVRVETISGTSSDGLDYGQPLVLATIVSTADGPLQLTLPPGSQLQPDADGPPLVALGFAQSPLSIGPQGKAQAGIVAFSTRVALHPTGANSYTLAEPTGDQQLVALLQAIQEEGNFIGPNLVHQRAIWQVATGADCAATDDAIQATFGVKLGCQSAEAQSVAALIAHAQPPAQKPPAQEPATAPVPLTPTAGGEKPGGQETSILLAIFGGVIVIVGLVIAALFLRPLLQPGAPPAPPNSPPPPDQPGGTPDSTGDGPTWRPDRAPGPTNVFDTGANAIKPRRQNSKTQTLDAAPQSPPPPPAPVAVAPPGRIDGVNQGDQAQPAATQPRGPSRRAAVTAMLHVPSLPEPLRAPSLLLAGMAGPAGEPARVLPFTILTRSHVQQSEIPVADGTVSSPHCMIRFEETQGWTISDLSSLNGTLVNDVRAQRRSTLLPDAAIIQLGSVKLRFQGNARGAAPDLVQIEPALNPQPVYHFDPNSHPYWLLTSRRLRTLEVANSAISVPHALISFDDGWTVRDLNSSGGSRLIRAACGGRQADCATPQRTLPGDQLNLANQVTCQVQTPDLPAIGAYQPIGWLGQGGAASVFLTYRTDDPARATLALKLLTATTDSAREAFKREAALLADLKHEQAAHIIPLHEAALDAQPAPYLVLEHIEGVTLRTLLRSNTGLRMTPGEMIAVALAVCAALAALHRRGWSHCDVKPENVLISQRGEVFLADFGSITRMNEQPVSATSAYAPPEFRAQPCGPATAAADIYSLGAVLYEMLTGMRYHHPQAAEPHRQVHSQAITGRLPAPGGATAPMPDSSNPLAAVIERCLRPLPGRLQQIDDVRDALEAVQQAQPAHVDLGALVKQVDAFL